MSHRRPRPPKPLIEPPPLRTWRRSIPLICLLLSAPVQAAEKEVVALINGEPVSLESVEALSASRVSRLHDALRVLFQETVDRQIDALLRSAPNAPEAKIPPPKPVTDKDIERFRQERREHFDEALAPVGSARDPEIQRASIRHYLEQKALEAVEKRARLLLRAGHKLEYSIPPADTLTKILPSTQTIATVDKQHLYALAVETAEALRFYYLRGELYRELHRNLEVRIEEHLLKAAAARRDQTVAELLEEITGDTSVSDDEVQEFMESERVEGRSLTVPERALPHLQVRKKREQRAEFVKELRKHAKLEINLEKPGILGLPVEEADAPALGTQDGPRLIVYTNARCGVCRFTHQQIDRLLESDPSIRVVFRDFIPNYDPGAREAARLSRCAARQGAFGLMRRELLERERPDFGLSWYSDEELAALADRLEIQERPLRRCLSAFETEAKINRDIAHARSLGFNEAPAFVAEGVPFSGAQSAEGLAQAIRLGLQAKEVDKRR